MAGPKLRRIQIGDVGPVRDADLSGAPSHVSLGAYSRTTAVPDVGQVSVNSFESRRVLSDRPSTSGGLPTRRPEDGQEFRGDHHIFPSRADHLGTTYYNFPLPASSPTPGATTVSSPPRTYSESEELEVNDLNYTYTEVGIGMAIGSPTQLPAAWSPQVQFRSSSRNQNYSPEVLDDWGVPSRTKSSRWRLLGGIFGKKAMGHDVGEAHVFNHNDYLNFPPPPPPEKARGRGKTTSEKRSKQHKPDMRRANTMPTGFNFEQLERPKEFPMMANKQKPLPMRSLLDVDIPSIQMERYSVMFGNVIKPPSLLARRQANLERLKTVEEIRSEDVSGGGLSYPGEMTSEGESSGVVSGPGEVVGGSLGEKQPRPRRGTSPLPTKSPAMSLFPTVPRTQRDQPVPMPRRSPLHRSNTSPAALSPNRHTFLPPKPIDKRLASNDPITRSSNPWSSDLPVPPDSPSSISSAEVQSSTPLKPAPKFTEPAWEMVKPLKADKPKRHAAPPQVQFNAIQRNQSVMISHPVHTLPRKQSLQSSLDALAQTEQEEEAEELINTAANISIARQISVSRRQKQMLVPIKAKMSGRSTPIENTTQTVVHVNERKPMTPMLVNIVSGRIERGERAVLVRA